jgi:hypothetical protein
MREGEREHGGEKNMITMTRTMEIISIREG